MLPEEEKSFLDKIRELSTEELNKGLAVGRWGSALGPDNRKYNLARLVLEERQNEEEKVRFNKTLKIAGNNVSATKNLAIATWALVIVTLLLVIFSAIK